MTVTPEAVHSLLILWAAILTLDISHRLVHSRRQRKP